MNFTPAEQTHAITPTATASAGAGLLTPSSTPSQVLVTSQRLSISGKGDDWATQWKQIISKAPKINPTNKKPYIWPAHLTHLLEHIWGPRGIDNVLKMADAVVENFDLYVTNADTVISKTSSPTK